VVRLPPYELDAVEPPWAVDTRTALTSVLLPAPDAMTTVADALRAYPGVHVDQPGGPGGRSSLYLRGGEENYTIVLLDGVPVNNGTDARGGGEEPLRKPAGRYARGSRRMLTVLELIARTTDFLAGKGVESPRLNAELLIGHVLGLPRMQLYLQFERPLTEVELAPLRPLVKRRGAREPLQYLLGATEFFHVKLRVDRRALIPRPETELLCELVTQQLPAPPAAILDLGTGGGAIALALAAYYPGAAVTALEASAEALALAQENAAALGLAARVRFLRSDWFAALEPAARFDLIAANPPYLSDAELAAAAPEVRAHEPRAALAAGEGGVAELRRILAAAPGFLAPGGLLALETGIDQHELLRAAAAAAGFARVESRRDLSDRERYLFAWRA